MDPGYVRDRMDMTAISKQGNPWIPQKENQSRDHLVGDLSGTEPVDTKYKENMREAK